MKRQELDDLLKPYASATERRYGHLVPVMAELYQAGLTIKQIEKLFPVSKKFIRAQLPKAGVKWRKPGLRDAAEIPSSERVLAILKKHGLRLEDLEYRPQPKGRGKKK